MAIRRSTRRIGAARIGTVARKLLDASTLCAISTVGPRGRAHINTAYFAWSNRLDVVWLSDPRAAHSRNVRARETVAIAIYDSHQSWGKPDRGIQLFGAAAEVVGAAAREAAETYAARFPEYRESELGGYRFYRCRPQALKVFDERALGAGVFVTATVRSGQVAWQRTEIYDGAS